MQAPGSSLKVTAVVTSTVFGASISGARARAHAARAWIMV
jgi:hypothetical protein